MALTVNFRWTVKSPAGRDYALRAVASALAGYDITWSVVDSPDIGALGLPRWSVIVFHAQHGDWVRLQRDVTACVAQHDELVCALAPLTE